MSKYEIITIHDQDQTFKAIFDMEGKQYFAGYDFMGSINWQSFISEAIYLDQDEDVDQIVKDLEAADEPAEPEIHVKRKFEVWAKRWSEAEHKQIMFLVGEFGVYFHAELFAKAYSDHFKSVTKIVEYKAIM